MRYHLRIEGQKNLVHVYNAECIPRIGDSYEITGLRDNEQFRVVDVKHGAIENDEARNWTSPSPTVTIEKILS